MASSPLTRVKLPSTDGTYAWPCTGQRGPETGQPVLARRHVQRPGDGGRVGAAAGDEVLGGQPGAGLLLDVHIAQWHRLAGPGREHGRHAEVAQLLRQRIVDVAGDEQHTVDVALAQVAQRPGGGSARRPA